MEQDSFAVLPHPVGQPRALASPPDAYELKFLLTELEAARAEAWARQRLTPDPHGTRGTYLTTTLYLDTALFDIYHKSPGYRRSKYRLRRYGSSWLLHLERKKRRGDRVRKQRESLPLAVLPRLLDPDAAGTWFGPRVRERLLRPSCLLSYRRTAFTGATPDGAMRLTLDRDVVGKAASDWTVPAGVEGLELFSGEAILELKFRAVLPGLFRELLGELPTIAAGRSKYTRCVEAWDLTREGG
jgi:hypothetical protein